MPVQVDATLRVQPQPLLLTFLPRFLIEVALHKSFVATSLRNGTCLLVKFLLLFGALLRLRLHALHH